MSSEDKLAEFRFELLFSCECGGGKPLGSEVSPNGESAVLWLSMFMSFTRHLAPFFSRRRLLPLIIHDFLLLANSF
jgi:hypothetical protein